MRYRDRIAYLGALSLFLSAIELLIPRVVPFFRIGLANIPVMAALSLPINEFSILLLVKAIGTSYISGTLFSPFFLMSLTQTVLAGFTMFFLKRFSKRISVYSISAAGALVSDAAQIGIASLYAGRGALSLLPVMLILSLPASILTAAVSKRIEIPDIPYPAEYIGKEKLSSRTAIIAFILSALALVPIRNTAMAAAAAVSCIIFQRAAGRKIRIMPHIVLFIFLMISSVLTPSGEVLFRILSFPVTDGAVQTAMLKSFKLSASIALSQGFSRAIAPQSGFLGQVLSLFSALLESFHGQKGSLAEKVQRTLASDMHKNSQIQSNNIPAVTLIAITVLLILFSISDYLFL